MSCNVIIACYFSFFHLRFTHLKTIYFIFVSPPTIFTFTLLSFTDLYQTHTHTHTHKHTHTHSANTRVNGRRLRLDGANENLNLSSPFVLTLAPAVAGFKTLVASQNEFENNLSYNLSSLVLLSTE